MNGVESTGVSAVNKSVGVRVSANVCVGERVSVEVRVGDRLSINPRVGARLSTETVGSIEIDGAAEDAEGLVEDEVMAVGDKLGKSDGGLLVSSEGN